MKKFFKTLAKAYACYLIISAISAAVLYIYGCIKYGRDLMNWGIRFSLSAYKLKLMQLFKIDKPIKLDTSGMLDWSEL